MKSKFTLFLASLFLVAGTLSATGQSRNRLKGTSSFHAKISFKAIQEYDKQHPELYLKKDKIFNEEDEEYPEFSLAGKKILYKEAIKQNAHAALPKDPSPMPDKDFSGLEDNNSAIPPDVNGAAGLDYLMVTLNTGIRIMDKEGNPVSTVSTGAFFHPIPGSGDVFDPKISYDPYENRWILVMPSSSDPASSRLMIAISENEDPTGNWFFYSFDSDPTNSYWFDYPNYGFNKKWIVVSGNMFGSGFGYAVLFVLNKADLYNNAMVANYSRFEIDDGFTLVPAVTYDPDEEDIYIVNNAGGDNGGYGYLDLRKVTGEPGFETIEDLGLIGIPEPWSNGSYSNGGNFAPQLGSDEKINTVDARMENMVFRNGKLWCVHHIYLPTDEPTRCSIQWWELSTDGTLLQHGRVDDTSGLMNYAFATIAVNAKEDVMIGYGSFSEEQYASSSFAFRYADDPPNTLRESYQYKDGLAPYYKTYGGERNRWGDYTATWVDPMNDLDFWTLQEYAEIPAIQDSWGTWWAHVNVDAAPEAHFAADITSVPVGGWANFTDQSKFEPDTWQWIFEGGSPTSSTEQNPQNIFYEQDGLYDVTLIASNYMGSDTLKMQEYINANSTVLPEVEFAVNDTIPCLGDTLIFTDQSIYDPTGWEWSFYPDSVNYVDGTNSHSQNPHIVFELPMVYEVTLTVTNNNGNASLTKQSMIHSGGLHLPFDEDFESMEFRNKAWTIVNPDNKNTWEIAQVEGNEPGNYAAFIDIKAYNGLGERDRLVSPAINLRDYSEASLQFQYAYAQRFPQYTDSLIVYLSDNCGETWTRLLALGQDSLDGFATSPPSTVSFVPQSPDDWCGSEGNPSCISVDLTPWAYMPDIRLVFETYNGFGNNIYVDNIVVNGTLSSTDELQSAADNISLFPNPSNGTISIKLDGLKGLAEMKISDIAGHTVLQSEFECIGNTLKTFRLPQGSKGIYIVEIRNKENAWVKKMVVK